MALSEKKKEQIAAELQSGNYESKAAVARKFRVSRDTVNTIERDLGDPVTDVVQTDIQLRAAKRRAKESERKYQDAVQQILELTTELHAFRECAKLLDDGYTPIKIPEKKGGDSVALPILVLSDWHIDEVIEFDSIGGVNEFNLDIARQRVQKLWAYSAKCINMLKKESKIDTLLIAALGDFMSAWIHEELVQTNSLTPPETILELFEMFVGGIDYLLDTGLVQRIKFVGACGNHGRITKRIQFKDRHKKSYEWLLYSLLVRHYKTKGEKRVTFQLPTGYFNWVEVFGRKIRFHHGDNVRYNGGIGGIHIPLRKAIAQWNKTRAADLDVMGHWHTMEWSNTYVINNSLIGYSAYAENIKADYMKAGQSLFLLHPKWGKTTQFPIVLQE